MPRPLLRKTIWTALVAAVLIAAVVLVLPFAASTRLVRDRIAQELGAWSGLRVELGAAPEIEIWPSLRAVLHDVRFSDRDRPELTVLESERIEVDISTVAALRGGVVFDHSRFVRPLLRIYPAAPYGYLPAWPKRGRVVRAVQAAAAAIKDNPEAPDLSRLRNREIGTLEFTDGRVVAVDPAGEHEVATGVTGKLNWPSINRGGVLRADGVWRGQPLSVEVASAQPLLHLAGGTAGLRVVLKAAPINASFDGTAGLAGDAMIDGAVQISTPAARDAARWLRFDLDPAVAPGAVEFAGQLSGAAQRLKFTNASLVLDGNTGIGGFDISFDGAVPAMSGTLAFDVLDLPTAFSVFSPLLPQASPALSGPTPLIDRMKLDLRLSASTARAGPVVLSEIAATAQVRPGLAVLDISDSTAFGGTFQAGIRADRTAGSESVDLRLLAANVNGGEIGDALGLQALVPAARGTLSLSLSGRGTSWQQVLETANGSLSAQFEAGTLRAFNLDTFLARLNDGGFFAWKDVTDGSLAVDAIQVKATMEAGVARVAEVSVDAPQRSVLLHGIVPYVGGLALSGSVVQRAAGEPLPQPSTAEDRIQPSTDPLASFFVGGSWKAPFISPTTVRPPPVPSGG